MNQVNTTKRREQRKRPAADRTEVRFVIEFYGVLPLSSIVRNATNFTHYKSRY